MSTWYQQISNGPVHLGDIGLLNHSLGNVFSSRLSEILCINKAHIVFCGIVRRRHGEREWKLANLPCRDVKRTFVHYLEFFCSERAGNDVFHRSTVRVHSESEHCIFSLRLEWGKALWIKPYAQQIEKRAVRIHLRLIIRELFFNVGHVLPDECIHVRTIRYPEIFGRHHVPCVICGIVLGSDLDCRAGRCYILEIEMVCSHRFRFWCWFRLRCRLIRSSIVLTSCDNNPYRRSEHPKQSSLLHNSLVFSLKFLILRLNGYQNTCFSWVRQQKKHLF